MTFLQVFFKVLELKLNNKVMKISNLAFLSVIIDNSHEQQEITILNASLTFVDSGKS